MDRRRVAVHRMQVESSKGSSRAFAHICRVARAREAVRARGSRTVYLAPVWLLDLSY